MTQGNDPNDPAGQGGYQPPEPQQPPQPPQQPQQPPPQYGQQPPQYGSEPPQYGGEAPQYGQQPPYGAQPPQYGQPVQYGGGVGYPAAPQTDQNAIIALVIAIVGLFICWPAGIVSLIMGMSSLRKIKESGDRIGGRGLAIGAIAVSILDILITIGIIVGFIIAIAASNGSSSY